MAPPDYFQTIAEIGIALAGFSGLLVTLRRREGPMDDTRKFRLRILLAMAFGALFLSLVPDMLMSLDLGEILAWRLSASVMLVFNAVFVAWLVLAAKQIMRLAPEIFDWFAFSRTCAGHFAALILQVLIIVQAFPTATVGLYSVCLIWYLLHAAQQFMRMLFVHPLKA